MSLMSTSSSPDGLGRTEQRPSVRVRKAWFRERRDGLSKEEGVSNGSVELRQRAGCLCLLVGGKSACGPPITPPYMFTPSGLKC